MTYLSKFQEYFNDVSPANFNFDNTHGLFMKHIGLDIDIRIRNNFHDPDGLKEKLLNEEFKVKTIDILISNEESHTNLEGRSKNGMVTYNLFLSHMYFKGEEYPLLGISLTASTFKLYNDSEFFGILDIIKEYIEEKVIINDQIIQHLEFDPLDPSTYGKP